MRSAFFPRGSVSRSGRRPATSARPSDRRSRRFLGGGGGGRRAGRLASRLRLAPGTANARSGVGADEQAELVDGEAEFGQPVERDRDLVGERVAFGVELVDAATARSICLSWSACSTSRRRAH